MSTSPPDLPRMAAYLAEQPDVIVAYHYGSTATGRELADSRVHIAVLFVYEENDECIPTRQLEIMNTLAEMVERDVLVTVLTEVSHAQAFSVIKDGKLIYERDKAERIEFEVMTMKLHFDFEYRLKNLSLSL